MKELVSQTRTYRKFDASKSIDQEVIEDLIELGRLGGSARNCQPWQYLVVTEKEICDQIFPHLGWAGYLTDWKGPDTHEQPVSYILCYLNKNWLSVSLKEAYFDLGIATQNMLLGATKLGIGGCRIGFFSAKLADQIVQPEHLELHLVIALGIPAEKVVVEKCSGDDIKYWRDNEKVHHVPKRALKDILLSFNE